VKRFQDSRAAGRRPEGRTHVVFDRHRNARERAERFALQAALIDLSGKGKGMLTVMVEEGLVAALKSFDPVDAPAHSLFGGVITITHGGGYF
jgi:hypothetical protein